MSWSWFSLFLRCPVYWCTIEEYNKTCSRSSGDGITSMIRFNIHLDIYAKATEFRCIWRYILRKITVDRVIPVLLLKNRLDQFPDRTGQAQFQCCACCEEIQKCRTVLQDIHREALPCTKVWVMFWPQYPPCQVQQPIAIFQWRTRRKQIPWYIYQESYKAQEDSYI